MGLLLAAQAGGLGVLDPGPAWRLACGMWTGHVALLWLIGGARQLLRPARRPWPRGRTLQALAAPVVLAALAGALTFRPPPWAGQGAWAWALAAGAACLTIAAALAAAGLAAWFLGAFGNVTRSLVRRANHSAGGP